MGGLLAIYRKELADHFSSYRFIILFALIAMVSFITSYMAGISLRDSLEGIAKPKFIFLMLFNTTGAMFSMVQFVAFFGPLIGLVLGFDAINRERADGTLIKVVSQPIYRHKYYLVHNGMIQNALELKAKHEQMGINYVTLQLSQFRSFWGDSGKYYESNDSEALAHEFALFLEGKQEKIEARGDIAFICLETDRGNRALKLHFARNQGAPLEMERKSSFMVIASENVSHQDIPPYLLHTYNYNTQEITQCKIELPEYELLAHFTPDSLDSYWDRLDDIEMRIQQYEDQLKQIEQAQFQASARGDTVRYQGLQLKKGQLEEQIQQLCEEWNWLERACFE